MSPRILQALALIALTLLPAIAHADGLGALSTFIEISFAIGGGIAVITITLLVLIVRIKRQFKRGGDVAHLRKQATRIQKAALILSALVLLGFTLPGGADLAALGFFGVVGLIVGAPLYIVTLVSLLTLKDITRSGDHHES